MGSTILAEYADNNTPFAARDHITDVTSDQLCKKLLKRIICFSDNQIKPNADKCHLFLNIEEQNILKIGNFINKNFFLKNYLVLISTVN